jgi:hypothetical protein
MAGAAQRLAAIRKWFAGRTPASLDDPAFQALHHDLAAHLKKVAATTSEQFGQPWGLVAMSQAANRQCGASILISGPKLVCMKRRALPAAVAASPS